MRKVCEHDEVPCILITGGLRVFGEIIFEAERCNLPVLRTLVPTPVAVAKVTAILEDSFVVRELLHGVLLDILGLGVLIVGESGIGKSECALDLDRARPSSRRRRHRRSAAARRDHSDRHVPRADAASHGDSRARRHQHSGSVRHRRRRAPRSASSWSCSSSGGRRGATTIGSA